MERDIPEVVAEVTACFRAYETALIKRDLDSMTQFFDSGSNLVRFGIADEQRGSDELKHWRAMQPPIPEGRSLAQTVIGTFGRDLAVVSTHFSYPDRAFVGRQSQTWIRAQGRWCIVHAHVSEIPLT